MSWYDSNPKKYIDLTQSVDMGDSYSKVAPYLKGLIWDLGCGSARDSLYFLSQGFQVLATDKSKALVGEVKSSHPNLNLVVDDILENKKRPEVDFIWACASLLHVPEKELFTAFGHAMAALKPGGYFYSSFKLGETQREKDGLVFTDLTLDRFKQIVLNNLPEAQLVEHWISADKISEHRPSWLNVVIRKKV